jgi:peptidoglycan/xylan/chitin deacetylase (PgdA/CDA1 family)
MLSSLGYSGLRAAGIPTLSRRFHPGGAILCYHNVRRERHTPRGGDPGLHLGIERFAEQLRWLTRHYSIVPLTEMVARIRSGRSVRGLVVLTFDDGYAEVLEVALPLLRDLRLPATVFVVADAPGPRAPFWWDHPSVVQASTEQPRSRQRWLHDLRGDQGAILATLDTAIPSSVPTPALPAGWPALLAATVDGIEVGAHSLRHRTLTALSEAELDADLTECRELIARHIGVRPVHFAYPYGIWDRRVRDAVRRAGYSAAVTLDRGLNTPRTDPWGLRRINVAAGIGRAAFECWVAGLRP